MSDQAKSAPAAPERATTPSPISAELRKTAQQHLDYMASPEFNAIVQRLFARDATDDDRLSFIETELSEAMACLEPIAPENGRAVDGWHASACVLRAWATLLKILDNRKLAAPALDALIAKIQKLTHWEVADDVQALRTRLACIGAAVASDRKS